MDSIHAFNDAMSHLCSWCIFNIFYLEEVFGLNFSAIRIVETIHSDHIEEFIQNSNLLHIIYLTLINQFFTFFYVAII